jgi:hypothetical protein
MPSGIVGKVEGLSRGGPTMEVDDLAGIKTRAEELGTAAFNSVSEADVRSLRDRAFPELAEGRLTGLPVSINTGILTT